MKEKVMVAMSGGVDSTTCAMLMLEQGYDVTGVTLHLFDGQEKALEDAEACAKQLGIKWYAADCRKFFGEDVISYFIRTYKLGKTPNPCCHCNHGAKFNYLYREMKAEGCTALISGHYARIAERGGRKLVAKGLDKNKDQSYYLCLMEPYQLDVVRFPLGEMTKSRTRELAKNYGLAVADKKDSQEVCFLMGGDYRDYLRAKLKDKDIKKGNFILDGKPLKQHDGIVFYTVGQRKGLGIGYHEPLYVSSIDPKTGDVHLGVKEESAKRGVKLKDCVFAGADSYIRRAKARLRYRMTEAPCTLEILPEDKAVLLFDEPQFSPAPGQVAAVYDDEVLLGGGFIESVF
ncbi:tRNA 2-thiouridine(34) synthase MnmA [Geovibrio thiophilus]|uniref:tRNA-specific 2-thiouridylase MnmA n=1 Tax=Geovibrio thiophilus TaxID=139438 RepID=A0A410JXB3_9BACT|nr:tRNA 2-thiouridine(34) synthase MnmA [Geovibrio thiophilus]QAR32812.1 tRNA 2-thiouridine(34) synthase MnmA [Geovibrio thiophilus]